MPPERDRFPAPNTLRAMASAPTDGARPLQLPVTESPDAGRLARAVRSRWVGALIAAVGVLFFFGPGLLAEEMGLAFVTFGVGLFLTLWIVGALRGWSTIARASKPEAVAGLVLLPHHLLIAAVGVALMGFGLLVLLIALGLI